jgi:hypothetical protein
MSPPACPGGVVLGQLRSLGSEWVSSLPYGQDELAARP